MPRGYPANLERHREIAELRASGMSYKAIGDRFGVSHQAIVETLQRTGHKMAIQVRCRKCKDLIVEMRMAPRRSKKPGSKASSLVYCLRCLPRSASFGQRLKACRLAAGLNLAALEKKSGVRAVGQYELEKARPTWATIAKFIRLFGVEWLDVR
jgi:DNA-binding XRE family transcriptional regulator